MALKVVSGREFPISAVTQTLAFIARKGHGKTYGAGKLVEQLLEHGAPVVILDPVGNWYGLRLGSAGTHTRGFPIPVFGGDHGDLPLTPDAGAAVAAAIVDNGMSAVLDVSGFRKGQRKQFVAAFAEELFQRAKKVRSPMMVVFEEAQVFAPQRTQRGEERMLGAVEDIVRLGRNYGLGSTLISQRPQSVNKEVLNQVECLFVGQLNASHERKAIDAWIQEKGVELDTRDLPSLPVGTMYMWSPQWLQAFEKVRILKKATFDASATPELGARRRERPKLSEVNLDELKKVLEDAVAEATANDPKTLRRRIAELERELERERAKKRPTTVLSEEARETISVLDANLETLSAEIQKLGVDVSQQRGLLHGLGKASDLVDQRPPKPARSERPLRQPVRDEDVPVGAAKILEVLAFRHSRGHKAGLTRQQIGLLGGMKPRGGSFNTNMKLLLDAKFIEQVGQGYRTTSKGFGVAGAPEPRSNEPKETLDLWRPKLSSTSIRIIELLMREWPRGLSKQGIGHALDIAPRGGSFNTALAKLRAAGLLSDDGGQLVASDDLMKG